MNRRFALARAFSFLVAGLLLISATPVLAGPHAPPLDVREPVVIPGPGERLLPLAGTEALQSGDARVRALLGTWVDGEGAPVLPFVAYRREGERAWLTVEGPALASLDDHDYELFLLAYSAAVHERGAGPRQLHVLGRSPEGSIHDELHWRPPVVERGVTPPEPPWWEQPLFQRVLPFRQGYGALAGRRVALSPGHGWTWTGSAWTTQRSDSFGLIEDFLTATIAHYHVDPYLVAHGADVVWLRERSHETHAPRVVDVPSAGFTEVGAWSDGSSPGGYQGAYRFATAGQQGVRGTWQSAATGRRVPVYAWWVAGSNRAAAAPYEVHHGGGAETVLRSQQRGGPHWQYLGSFDFTAPGRVSLLGQEGATGVLIADALLFGTATGGIRRNGAPSGHPAWQENSRNYAEFSGAPAAVYAARANERDSDVVARPLWANRLGVDAYVSVHTNAAGGTGTETFIMNTNPTPGSATLSQRVHTQLVSDVRAYWNAGWTDRGQKTANFGELRELTNAPGILVEVAFHDRNPATGPDVPSLHDPRFRRIAGRAIARGVVRYFDASAPFVPEPPLDLRLRNTPEGLRLTWTDRGGREGASPATSWRVFVARGDAPFDAGRDVSSPSFLLEDAQVGEAVHMAVVGRNAGGISLMSRTVSALRGQGAGGWLLVNAYRRWDRATGEAGNTGDEVRRWAEALASVGARYAVDGATREALDASLLGGYEGVLWQAGRDYDDPAAFSPLEAGMLADALESGQALVVSGATLATALAGEGERRRLRQGLGLASGSAAARTSLAVGGVTATVSQTTDALFYAVPEVEVLVPASGATGSIAWPQGGVAVTWRVSAAQPPAPALRAALIGLPVEALREPAGRAALLLQVFEGLGVSPEEDPVVVDPDPDPSPEPGPGDDVRQDVDLEEDVAAEDIRLEDSAPPERDAHDDIDPGSDVPGPEPDVSVDLDAPDQEADVVERPQPDVPRAGSTLEPGGALPPGQGDPEVRSCAAQSGAPSPAAWLVVLIVVGAGMRRPRRVR